MHVLVAPDKFKGTLDAMAAAEAMARGVMRAAPSASVELLPVADGGDGTASMLAAVTRSPLQEILVDGPLGYPVSAPLVRIGADHVFLDSAVPPGKGPRRPLRASTEGVGQLIRAAVEQGGRRITVGVGGTQSTDGGTGMARVLGWRFLDADGADLACGGGDLGRLAAVIPPDRPCPAEVVGACDVMTPLLGPSGAATLFSPQKGATPQEGRLLEAAMARLAEVATAASGERLDRTPGAGAGGGLGFGLSAFCGAQLRSGFDLIAGYTGLDEAIERADVVITGEGSFDEGSLAGKAPVSVAAKAAAAGIPCLLVAGITRATRAEIVSAGFRDSVALSDEFGREVEPTGAGPAVEEATARLMVRFLR